MSKFLSQSKVSHFLVKMLSLEAQLTMIFNQLRSALGLQGITRWFKLLFTYLEYFKSLTKFRFKASLNEGLYKQFNKTRQ